MGQGSTFPWYASPATRSLHSPFEYSCVEYRAATLLPSYGTAALITHWFTSPVVPAGIRLPVALFPPAPFFLSAAIRVVPVWFLVLFSLSPISEVPSPRFSRKIVQDSPDTEFAMHFIITLDGNKLKQGMMRARRDALTFRYEDTYVPSVFLQFSVQIERTS